MELLVNGHPLYVEIHGPASGLPVVLLHHGLGSTRAWKNQIQPLVQAGFRVMAYDRWGYGRSGPRHGIDIPAFEQDLADLQALLDHLRFDRPYLVGHSDGGTIALYFTARNPGRIPALVVIAAHIYVEPKMEPGIKGVKAAFETDPRLRVGLQRVHGEKTARVMSNWYEGWVQESSLNWDMRPGLGSITCPTLVVQGEDDEHATPQHALNTAAAIPGAQAWIVAGAGHMLPQEQPEMLNPRLIEFLQSIRTAGPSPVDQE